MDEESQLTSSTELPSLYEEGSFERLTPKEIDNNPADCEHFFEIIDGSSREIVCKKCPYGGAFRLGVDLDELREGKPYLKGKEVFFKKIKL